MATAILSVETLLAPLHAFIDWLTPRPLATKPLPAAPAPLRAVSIARPRSRPLRVVRVFDGPRVPSQAGRMVISGRMADVCAELDRLAALEVRGLQ